MYREGKKQLKPTLLFLSLWRGREAQKKPEKQDPKTM